METGQYGVSLNDSSVYYKTGEGSITKILLGTSASKFLEKNNKPIIRPLNLEMERNWNNEVVDVKDLRKTIEPTFETMGLPVVAPIRPATMPTEPLARTLGRPKTGLLEKPKQLFEKAREIFRGIFR